MYNWGMDDLKQRLTDEQYRVTQEKGTERPFSGKYNLHFENGVYSCVCCGADLFESDAKYDHGCGWPAFTTPLNGEVLREVFDESHGMRRTEVVCHSCGAHLGHVFPDGPRDRGGMRYCINSAALGFQSHADDV